MCLRHIVGDGTEGGHRAERDAFVVHVESCDDHTDASVGQFVTHLHESHVEELGFVDAHHIAVRREQQDACRRVDGRRHDMLLVVTDNILLGIPHIDGGLEDLHLLTGELCPAKTADQLLGLAREHRTAHHLYSSRAMRLSCHVFCYHDCKISKTF